jgi:uncharacterized protein YbjT (DUF2867 family)
VKVILFGATGMLGSGTLIECIEHPDVEHILVVGRRSCGRADHEKVDEILHHDFEDYSAIVEQLRGYDACFFCLGVSAAGMSEAKYTRMTHSLTMSAAEALRSVNPQLAFCYVSAQGADSTEQGRVMWARVRGRLENHLMALGGPIWIFRPGVVQPMKGVRSGTKLYSVAYTIFGPLIRLLRTIPGFSTSTDHFGLALIRVARDGSDGNHFTTRDIEELAAAEISELG